MKAPPTHADLSRTQRELTEATEARARAEHRLHALISDAERCASSLELLTARIGDLRRREAAARAHLAAQDAEAAELLRAVPATAPQREELSALEAVQSWPAGEHVYFAVEVGAAFCKVGYTARSSTSRCADLQIGSPRHLVLVATLAGGRNLEQGIHRHFAIERVRGEWFRVSERLAALVLEVRHGHDMRWFVERATAAAA